MCFTETTIRPVSPWVFWARWVLCSERRTADKHWESSSASPENAWTDCSEWESASSSPRPANTHKVETHKNTFQQHKWTIVYNMTSDTVKEGWAGIQLSVLRITGAQSKDKKDFITLSLHDVTKLLSSLFFSVVFTRHLNV